MVQFDFRNINVVPIGNEFIDLTHHHVVVHKGLKIDRVRKIYTQEVKKTELGFRGKLSAIIHQFPLLDQIHPLYTDLLRLVLDRDRYKLALDQVNTARILISNIGNDHVKLLKFSETLKQCKSLKMDATRNMFSVVNEITPSLAYLEQIRTHMVKLPLIDPSAPSLLVCGYPHVDKTCFMNRVNSTGTERSENLFVGHVGYKDLMYQVIDAPGVLDKPVFGECNVITALACHLPDALVLFFLDVSGSCGYSIADQVAFFYCLKSMFVSKPMLIVCNETDLMQVCDQDWNLIEEMNSEMGEYDDEEVGFEISNLRTEGGVMSVKNVACERLLDQRMRLSSLTLEEAKILRSKYIVAHQQLKEDEIIIPQNLDNDDDDDDKESNLLIDSEVLLKPEEVECEGEGLKQAKYEEDGFKMAEKCFAKEYKDQLEEVVCEEAGLKQAKYEEDGFVMAQKCFAKEYKDQLVATRKAIIAFAFFLLVGNSYGAIQQCLFTLCF